MVWYYMYVHDWMADYPSCLCLCCVMTHLPMYVHSPLSITRVEHFPAHLALYRLSMHMALGNPSKVWKLASATMSGKLCHSSLEQQHSSSVFTQW